jgi:lysophospholipase L1-like esterase
MSTLKSRTTQRLLALLAAAAGLRGREPCSDPLQSLERQSTEQRQTPCDWGGRIRCGSNNSDLQPPAAGENRVVYFGDQVTDVGYRGSADFLSDRSWLNRGSATQITDQVLVRLRQDVIDLYPKVVGILVGVNYIGGAHGNSPEEMILDNLMSMSGIAPANGIRVLLVSATPVCSCSTKSTGFQRWQGRIAEANELIQKHCAGAGAVHLEYYSAIADGGNSNRELTSESVLPNNAGYRVTALLAEKAVAESLHR